MAEEQDKLDEMETETKEPVVEPEPEANPIDWKAESRKWEARAKENGRKAKLYDEAQEAAKSDLQKATERADAAEAELAAIRAQQARDAEIRAAAAKYAVDADTLARMGGDVEENAAFLNGKLAQARAQAEAEAKASMPPAYPKVNDPGEIPVKGVTKEEIESIKDQAERVRMRAKHLDLYK